MKKEILKSKVEIEEISMTELKQEISMVEEAPPQVIQEETEEAHSEVVNEIDSLVSSLLSDLSRFQKRAKELNPLKARRAKRLVFGFREILKNESLLGVVVANKVFSEIPSPISQEIERIKSLCFDKKIPCILALSRNQLGRASGKSVRQNAVGIISVEGANDTWKKILEIFHS